MEWHGSLTGEEGKNIYETLDMKYFSRYKLKKFTIYVWYVANLRSPRRVSDDSWGGLKDNLNQSPDCLDVYCHSQLKINEV